ncbi:MAG TPA: glycosyltransferase family 39 protein, partial [Methylomirabilota bacterium]|nr:glycosyltransferase family 39 protein [Methylomirabilota bacterium]
MDGHRLHRARGVPGIPHLSGGRRAAAAALAAVLTAAALLLPGLGRAPFDDPGEGMHAEIARELALSGDPGALTLNGVRYVDKPPLLYALMAAAFALGGFTETAARSVPALAALAAVAATAWLGARLLGVRWGVLAGLGLLTSIGFFAYGRYVRPETLFVGALAWGFSLALAGLAAGRRWQVSLGLAAFGLAALAKDPLGALAPPLAIGAALALARRARPLGAWLPWPGVAAALALGFGWWVLAEARTPGFAWYTVVDNHLLNVARARRFP